MKSKGLYAAGILILLGMAVFAGCGKKDSPLQASSDSALILTTLANSGYTHEEAFGGTDDGTTTPQGFTWSSGGWAVAAWDTLKPVRFARHITRKMRTVKIDSLNAEKTRAWVTITHDLAGNFYDNSSYPYDPYKTYIRPIDDDKWVRHV